MVTTAVLVFKFQRRILKTIIGPRRFKRNWWRLLISSIVNAILLLISFVAAAAIADSNPNEQAHERHFRGSHPLEDLIWNLDASLGATNIEYHDYGVFSTRTVSLDFVGHSEMRVPMTYGFLGQVFAYDDPRLNDAISLLKSLHQEQEEEKSWWSW